MDLVRVQVIQSARCQSNLAKPCRGLLARRRENVDAPFHRDGAHARPIQPRAGCFGARAAAGAYPKLPFSTVAVHELGQLHEAYKHLRSSRHGSCGRLKTLCGLLGSAVRYRGGLYVIGTAVPLPSATGSDPHGMGPSHHNVARQAHKMAHTRPWWPRSSIAARARRISAHLECTPCSQQHATSNWLGSDNVWGSHTLRSADRELGIPSLSVSGLKGS